MRNYLPATSPGHRRALAAEGLYQILRAAGVHLRLAEQTIGARRATATEAKLLAESRGAPLLTMARTAYDDGAGRSSTGARLPRLAVLLRAHPGGPLSRDPHFRGSGWGRWR